MIKKLKHFAKTELIRTLFFSSLSTFFKATSALFLNKVVAGYVGPVGVALVGQFNSFLGIITTIGSGGIETGVVKYVAQHQGNDIDTRKVISTAAFTMTVCSLTTALVIFLFAGYFSNLLFKSQEYKFILQLAALSLIFVAIKGLLMSILNGHREVTKYTWVNIITSLSTLVLSFLLVVKYKLTGVLTALVVCQFLGFTTALFFTIKYHWFKINYFFQSFNKRVLKNLSAYSIMTVVASFSFPVTMIIVRNYISSNLAMKDAGYWQGVWLISEGYLSFFIQAISFYYLPRLSQISEKKELRKEIFKVSKVTIPMVSAVALFIFFIRVPLIDILFTPEFRPMLPLFKWQLMGDIIKFAGWLISYQMISQGMTRLFVFTAIFFNATFVILAELLLKRFGLEGVTMAFCTNGIIYLIFILFAFRSTLFTEKQKSIADVPDMLN